MARAASREVDIAISNAWHTSVFGLSMYAGKMKGKRLSDFLSNRDREPQAGSKAAEAIAFFNTLKARGFNVEITRH